MILEVADMRIYSGRNAAFEEAVQRGIDTVAVRAKGFQDYKLIRSIESPDRYLLQARWAKLEDHTVAFRQGPLFAEWLAVLRPFVTAPPGVEHFETVSPASAD